MGVHSLPVAHRSMSKRSVEHTTESYRAAMNIGAGIVESLAMGHLRLSRQAPCVWRKPLRQPCQPDEELPPVCPSKPAAGMHPAMEYVHPLNISAASYWELQQKEAFRNYLAGLEGSAITTVSRKESTDANGHKRVVRVSKIAKLHNPVPQPVRKVCGAGDEFFFTITETFCPDRFGVDHKLTATTEAPVMADRIKATGHHWVRVTGPESCELVWSLEVSVKVLGVGGIIEMGVRDAAASAYAQTVPCIQQFLALRGPEVELQAAAASGTLATLMAALVAGIADVWTAGRCARSPYSSDPDTAAATDAAAESELREWVSSGRYGIPPPGKYLHLPMPFAPPIWPPAPVRTRAVRVMS
jgi:hypothetical protein